MPHQCTNCSRTFPDGSKEMLSGCPDCGGNKFQFAPGGTKRGRESGAAGDGSDGAAAAPGESVEDGSSTGPVSRAAGAVRDWVGDGSASGERSTDGPESTGRTKSTGGTESTDTPPTASDGSSDELDDEFPEWPETAREPGDRPESRDGATTGSERESSSGDPTDSSPEADTSGPIDTSPSTDRPSDAIDGDEPTDEDAAQASARTDVVSPDELPPASDVPTRTVPDEGLQNERAPDHGRVVSEPTGDRPSLDELREELNDQFESIKIVNPGQYELNLMELYDREEQIISLQEDGRYVINVPDSWRESNEE